MRKENNKILLSRFSVNLLISIFIIALPLQANAYSVSGNVLAWGASDGVLTDRTLNGGTATALSDSASSLGSGGASAQSAYFVDLSTGLLGTSISGYNPNTYDNSIAASAESTVSFNESLTFTIAAGTYASDLYVSAHGFVNGVLSASGCDAGLNPRCANVFEIWTFGFGTDSLGVQSSDTLTYPDNSPNIISENFTLTTRVLTAGTYETDQTAFASIGASLQGKGGTLGGFSLNGATETSFVADFYNTGGFTSLATPDGVTWTSDSGVFLSAVPVPAAVWLFGSGLLGLVGIARRKKS